MAGIQNKYESWKVQEKPKCTIVKVANWKVRSATIRGAQRTPPTACLDLKYASISSPVVPGTRNKGKSQPESAHVTQHVIVHASVRCRPVLQQDSEFAPPEAKICLLRVK